MAQLPRIAASVSQAVTSAQSRTVTAGRINSVSSASLNEASASAASQFDTAPYNFNNSSPDRANDDQRQPGHKRQHFGLLNAPSEAFASILGSGSGDPELDSFGNPVSKVFANNVSKAIKTYELNHKIISGTNPVRGTEISLTL